MEKKNARRGPGENFKNRVQFTTFTEVKQRARHLHGWSAQEALHAVVRWLGKLGYGPTATTLRKPVAAVGGRWK